MSFAYEIAVRGSAHVGDPEEREVGDRVEGFADRRAAEAAGRRALREIRTAPGFAAEVVVYELVDGAYEPVVGAADP